MALAFMQGKADPEPQASLPLRPKVNKQTISAPATHSEENMTIAPRHLRDFNISGYESSHRHVYSVEQYQSMIILVA
jgi:hypothetical protein